MSRDQADPLFARADRAIEENRRLRAEVRGRLDRAAAASARVMRSIEGLRMRPPDPGPAQTCASWSMSPLRAARPAEIVRRGDAELEAAWLRALPLIETPPILVRR